MQYLDNHLHEGHWSIDTTGSVRPANAFAAPITRCTVHRRHTMDKGNSGHIRITGKTRDDVVEGCTLANPMSVIRADGDAEGLVFRNNQFFGAPRYQGKKIADLIVLPGPPK